MVRIIFVRHGETQWNLQKRCQGQTDVELTFRGLSQGKILAQRLKNYPLEVVYTSDLQRAKATAQEVINHKDTKIPIISEPLLREFHFGVWEGLTTEEIFEKYRELALKRNISPHVEIPQGEKYADLVNRCQRFVENCLAKHRGNVLAVTHSVFIKALLHHYLQLPWPVVKNNLYIDNCSLTILKVTEGKVVVERINDTAHFELLEVVEARH
ncbi:alpha-ribazole phosphatase [Anaerobranca californiensis DSM 14826]|jgi:broad specificity phosphatase PhoE|uniref:Alpha-ribazole phosphatase n=1 Tax=Anaerobranca californiensis DSM 14826 TaxID=1120989 RepID=A0A1M6L9L0_9FIRM|nr:histidine phosphatase family protein [Anaerobranca californiensis]SHJ67799.1 alpha-ribazole phosphatase [Anaerobranca californiensis DSM 14826]